MDKVYSRTRLAISRVTRRAERHRKMRVRQTEAENRRNRVECATEKAKLIRQARIRSREDWELGPLAPRRDVGEDAEKYGTVPQSILGVTLELPPKKQKWMPIVKGDRVVVIRGKEKGKIGFVEGTNVKGQSVSVLGLHTYEVSLPKWMRQYEQSDKPSRHFPAYVPLSDVRLVLPIINPATGETKDTIIEGIERQYLDGFPPPKSAKELYYKGQKREYIRVVPALNGMEIPWPEREKPPADDYDVDTLRITVEEKTWVPTLATPPMPDSVLDELRHKYSVFRTRHTPEYIEAKEAAAQAEKAREKSAEAMRTPLKELQRHLRSEKKKQSSVKARESRGELTGDDLLSRLGGLMLERRGLAEDEKKVGDRTESSAPKEKAKPKPPPPDTTSTAAAAPP